MNFAWLTPRARNVYSQFGEDGLIEAVFQKIGTENRWCFECGAADGLFFSNTRLLSRDDWNTLLVEADPASYDRLLVNTRMMPNIRTRQSQLRAVDSLFAEFGVPTDLDLAVFDVDGQEYYLFNSMIRWRPRVVLIEFDPNADPWFIPEYGGPGQAGLLATIRLAAGKFYTVVAQTWCNLLLVRQPLDQLLDRAG